MILSDRPCRPKVQHDKVCALAIETWQHQLFTKIIHVSDEEIEVKEDPVTSDDDPWDWESSL